VSAAGVERRPAAARPSAGAIGACAAAAALSLAIALGSRGFRDFDPALTHYAVAAVLAAAAVAYRYAAWLARPPTRRYVLRTLELVRARGSRLRLAGLAGDRLVAQRFLLERSRPRWLMHLCLSWGTMLAFAITFPLVFGWIHFESAPLDPESYRAVLFGVVVDEFSIHSWKAFVAFNALNLSALLVLAGVALALVRRLGLGADAAIQRVGHDLLPLLLLLAVAASGLALTISSHAFAGRGYGLLSVAHAATVIGLLVYIPFGKLFHAVQRPAHAGVGLYKRAGAMGPSASCARCGDSFASAMHVDDLKTVLDELGLASRSPSRGVHPQDVCPNCRRRLVALVQGRLLGR